MSFLEMSYMAFETVTSGFAGVSWADATAANKSTEVKSFINFLSIWDLDHYCIFRQQDGRCRFRHITMPAPGVPDDDLVSFSDDVLDSDVNIRKTFECRGKILIQAFRAFRAGRQAETAVALPGWLLQLQQQTLAPQTAAVAAQFAVLIDHAMTRNQNGDPVAPVGGAHGARCSGTPHRPRQVLIGARFAVRDPEQARPHLALECRPRIGQRDGEFPAGARKVFAQLRAQLLQVRRLARHKCHLKPLPQGIELRLQHAPLGELQQADPGVHRARHHRPHGRLHPREADTLAAVSLSRSGAEHAGERAAEAAVRIEARVEDGLVERLPAADAFERLAQPSRAAVGLERHSIVAQKLPAHAPRVEPQLAQFSFADPYSRTGVDRKSAV